mgnify:CR=1 FL=1
MKALGIFASPLAWPTHKTCTRLGLAVGLALILGACGGGGGGSSAGPAVGTPNCVWDTSNWDSCNWTS